MNHVELGPCDCGAIHFTCPRCERGHSRGYVNGVDLFRCLGCGYVGHGLHPDEGVDQAAFEEAAKNVALDASLGLKSTVWQRANEVSHGG